MMTNLKIFIKDNFLISKMLKFNAKVKLKLVFQKAGLNKNAKTIFDIGANIGSVVLDFLKYFPKAKIWAFEPSSKNFEMLKWRIRKYIRRVNLFKLGLFNETMKKELHITSYHPAHSLLPLHKDYKQIYKDIQEINTETIMVIKLDDFVKQNNIEHIDIIKIDVEGVEYEVLEGGMNTLKEKTDSIILEISLIRKGRKSDNLIKILDLLNKSGFYLRDIYNLTKKTTGNQEFINEIDCVFKK